MTHLAEGTNRQEVGVVRTVTSTETSNQARISTSIIQVSMSNTRESNNRKTKNSSARTSKSFMSKPKISIGLNHNVHSLFIVKGLKPVGKTSSISNKRTESNSGNKPRGRICMVTLKKRQSGVGAIPRKKSSFGEREDRM